MSVEVYAPASMGNISVGFDLLGAALAPLNGELLGDKVRAERCATGLHLTVSGPYAERLPSAVEDNIVWQCAAFFLQQQGIQAGVRLHLDKQLPVGSGLGSSASSVVAALSAMNQLFGEPLAPQALLHLMGRFEGQISGAVHYDNVAPCFLGGMQLMLPQASHHAQPQRLCEPLPLFKHWYWVVAYSGLSLSTAKMRALLPQGYDRTTCIEFGRYLAGFIHACYRGDEELALTCLKDVLAEPYRADAIPGFTGAKAALSALGVDVCGISGSGPTLFAICRDEAQAEQAADWLGKHYLQSEGGFVRICQLDHQGARVV
ncbi:homoserine kinase [Shewanella sp. NFH-SH190041]|uniref:homoserine kinase n=1 Tax=Shewanella sp. NFH-SH190041 TaxID=2950245 RepID=UPI0021C2FEF1|nr:homoserine kinase [Shewanella sp. NFH-SH190041]BDM63652.1 homoserine kinase [Shewanella sp. NFH-SH190041]